MKVESELSDKEWRQMRRQMPKLEFEPVPETPALLPRSLYVESDKELGPIEEEEPEKYRESVLLGGDVSSNHHDSPKHQSTNVSSYGSPCKLLQKQSEANQKISRELPSTSMAVSPLITSRYRPREQKRPPESKLEIDDIEIAALDTEMAEALEAARRSAMGRFMELRAKQARGEAIERMKLSAAHTNDVAILQNKVKELEEKITQAEAQREVRDLLLDRFSGFAVRRSHNNQIRWGEGRSLAACFRAWNAAAQQIVKKRCVLHRVFAQYCKRQQLPSFRLWKESVQGFLLQKHLQDQRDRYEHRIVGVAQEYQLKIQQLQQDLDEAKCQVTESQKCCQKLEEDLRLIFLRGVSAMNIEALTVFGSSHKQNRKLGDQVRLIPQSQSTGRTLPSNELISRPAVPSPPKPSTSKTSLEAPVPDPVAVESPNIECSTASHARVSVGQSSTSQMPPNPSKGVNGWSRSTSSALRSAEMVRQHGFSPPVNRQCTNRSVSSSYRPSSAPSPTKKRSSPRLNTKYEVEMQYMRSTVAASVARVGGSAWTRPASSTRSPLSSTTSRRS